MAVLKNKQTLLEIPKHKLIGDVSTRWNSTYDMLNRYFEQRIAIEATLMSKDVKKNAKDIYTLKDDIASIERMIQILKPLKTVTTLLCGEKSPTVSLLHPLKEMLMQQLQVSDDDSLCSAVKNAILQDIRPRYTDPEMQLFLRESSCLDPRFKAMPYITEDDREEVFNSLVKKVQQLQSTVKVKKEKSDDCLDKGSDLRLPTLPTLQDEDQPGEDDPASLSASSTDLDEPPTKKPALEVEDSASCSVPPTTQSALDDLFGDVFVVRVEPAKPFEARIKSELDFYKSAESIPLSADPFDWWQKNESNLPILGQLALKYLCIPATSVASERVFSTAGDLVSAQRACLSCDQVDRLIFLKKNFEVDENNN